MRFLFSCTELEELLYDVISKNIGHKVVGGGENLLEYELLLGGRGALQLLLDEPGTVLVLGELNDVVGDLPQLKGRIPVVPETSNVFIFRL